MCPNNHVAITSPSSLPASPWEAVALGFWGATGAENRPQVVCGPQPPALLGAYLPPCPASGPALGQCGALRACPGAIPFPAHSPASCSLLISWKGFILVLQLIFFFFLLLSLYFFHSKTPKFIASMRV